MTSIEDEWCNLEKFSEEDKGLLEIWAVINKQKDPHSYIGQLIAYLGQTQPRQRESWRHGGSYEKGEEVDFKGLGFAADKDVLGERRDICPDDNPDWVRTKGEADRYA